MRLLAKPYLAHVKDPAHARTSFERTARFCFKTPPYSLFLPDQYRCDDQSRSALWVSSGRRATRRRVILYLHGGGYLAGSPHTHRAMTARLSRLTGLAVFAPSYRLAPEHPYPAALNDASAGFAALEARGYHHGDIVIGGDSVGGGLALALLSQLCRAGQPPRATFIFSPWTDLTLSGRSLVSNRKSDPILPVARIEEMRNYYARDSDPRDPGMSPLFASYPACTPVLIQVSGTLILRDDSVRMTARLRQQGAHVSLDEWDDAPHVWHLLDGWLPEARAALTATAEFIRQAPGPR